MQKKLRFLDSFPIPLRDKTFGVAEFFLPVPPPHIGSQSVTSFMNDFIAISSDSKFSLPGLEILTFAFATWLLQGYLVTDSFDLAFRLLPEFEIEYFEASLENHGFDHLKNGNNICLKKYT